MKNKIKVKLKDNSYNIIIGNSILSNINDYLVKYSLYKNILVIIDEVVLSKHKNILKYLSPKKLSKINIYPLKVNESIKSYKTIIKIHSYLLEKDYSRDTTIIVIGGGVIGDLGGFVASTYMRGVHLINIPTTLLSMVDSAVGGKTGINFNDKKNIIGTFYQPKLVLADTEFLTTLPKAEITSGLGEVIKYSYLSDEKFFVYLKNNYKKIYKNNSIVLQKLIYNSLLIKSNIVEQDEKEDSLRKILNLGHTFAHAFETNSKFKIKHGMAVIAGLTASFYLSHQLGIINNKSLDKYLLLPATINIGSNFKKIDNKKIYSIMKSDKKNIDGKIKFVLIKDIGEILIDVIAKPSQIYSAIDKTRKLYL